MTFIHPHAIAITGMACRFPGANNIDQFWENLRDGVESLTYFSDDELLAAGIDPSWLDNPNYVKASAILEDVTSFDADFFDISPCEAEITDPQQRLFLECAWEALESAGYTTSALAGRVGVFAGSRFSEYLMFNQGPIDLVGLTTDSPIVVTQRHWSNDKDFLATRVSFKLNLKGPSVTVQTACSTSLMAIHLACQSLLAGECDVALAGGVCIRVPQKAGYLHSEGMIFSPDGHTRSLDAQAGGTIFSSGAGVVTLKRLNDASADGDCIRAVIRGTAVNNDGGGEKTNYSAPSVAGQASVIMDAQERASVDPSTITCIEAHGTATPAGDPIEVAGLIEAFRAKTQDTGYCAIGSVKSNIGHTVQAAGVAGIIKVALMLEHKELVPTLHYTAPNPRFDLENSPFYVNTEHREWSADNGPRRAGVSSFGVGGTNAHIVLEEAPARPKRLEAASIGHLLSLSAQNENALSELASRYVDYCRRNPDAAFADICFTANAGRNHFDHRLTIFAKSVEEVKGKLTSFINGEEPAGLLRGTSQSRAPAVAFLFTGQGSQYVGMGRQLYEIHPVFRSTLDRCNELLKPHLGVCILDILYPDDETSGSQIHETVYTQPALFALEYSLAILWQSWGINPTIVMGHSIGEYVAACVAGVFSLEDGLKLVAARGRLMQSIPRIGEMAALLACEEQVATAIAPYAKDISIAAVNGPKNIVISGTSQAVQAVCKQLNEDGVQTRPLNTSHAFHSQLMDPVLDAFEHVADTVSYSFPRITLISNVTGQPVGSETPLSANYWRRHAREAVQFSASIETLVGLGCGTFVEIGPHPTLLGMGRQCLAETDGLWLPSLRKGQDEWRQLCQSLAALYVHGIDVNWANWAQLIPSAQQRRIELPTYPFQRKRYWIEPSSRQTKPSNSPIVLGDACHPLLGYRHYSPLSDIQFVAEISFDSPSFLQEHRVYDTVPLPATAFVEMAHAAASEVLKSDLRVVVIEDLVILQPLLFAQNDVRTVHVIVSPTSEASADFTIFSLATTEEISWIRHASGKCRITPAVGQQDSLALEDLQARCDQPLSIDAFYQEKRHCGLYHGPQFQGVKKLWRTDNEVLALVCLPDTARASASNYRLHPALLDACIQIGTALFVIGDDGDALYIPMVWERITFHGPVPAQVWSHAIVQRGDRPNREIQTVDLRLYDENGQTLVSIDGLHYKRAERATFMQSVVTPTLTDWLYKVEWETKGLPDDVPQLNTAGRWLIFADEGDIGDSLAQHFRSQGGTCTLVLPGNRYEAMDDGRIVLNPANAADFQTLLDDIFDVNDLQSRGLVYLWGASNIVSRGLSTDKLEAEQALQCGGLLHLVQTLANTYPPGANDPRLWVITQGAQPVGRQPGPYSIAQATLWGQARVIMREHPEFSCTLVDLDPAGAPNDLRHLFAELGANDVESQVAFRNDRRYVARLVQQDSEPEPKDDALKFPGKQPYRLESGRSGTLDELALVPAKRRAPGPGEIEIQIYATGLNFRDVLIALRRFDDVLGRECSGVVVACGTGVTEFKVGDPVMAIAPASFASFVTIDAHFAVHKPHHLTFEAAATVPMVFLTAYYGLHTLADIAAGDRILIHAASGGVGHAAIHLAQQAGAEIYVTASKKKWAYLRSMGIENIMDSRSLDFADELMDRTNGQGVDIVLNSLAGEFIPKSLATLGKNGCFIELGATNVWDADQVGQIRPDVSYHWFHLGKSVAQADPGFLRAMFETIIDGFNKGRLKPLPHYTFPVQEAIEAFRMMSQARHIGKIVVSHRACISAPDQESQTNVNPRNSYLVTGGLGGLGLKVVRWLGVQGARHIVLMGRSAPSEDALVLLKSLNDEGVEAVAVQADVTQWDQLSDALETIRSTMPPLGGIIHAAGVLDDGVLQQQTWSRFAHVMSPKVVGAWNLHLLTQGLPLDFFVLFSSVSSLLGGSGQGNYAAANAFLDTLAHYRRAQGLTAVSINWGAWSEVGMAADLGDMVERRRSASGIGKIEPTQGLQLLAQILKRDDAQVGVIPVDWSKYIHQFSAQSQASFLAQISRDKQGKVLATESASTKESMVLQRLEKASSEQKRTILVHYIQTEIAKIGGLDASQLETNHGLLELGIDSLMAIQLRNRITSELRQEVPMTEFLDNPNILHLANLLLDQNDSTERMTTIIPRRSN